MNLSLIICYFLLFLFGIVTLCLNRKHVIIRLLRLELIVLSLFCCLSFILSIIIRDLYILLVFLVFRVCEGVIGLSCLIIIIRSHGNDKLLLITIITC